MNECNPVMPIYFPLYNIINFKYVIFHAEYSRDIRYVFCHIHVPFYILFIYFFFNISKATIWNIFTRKHFTFYNMFDANEFNNFFFLLFIFFIIISSVTEDDIWQYYRCCKTLICKCYSVIYDVHLMTNALEFEFFAFWKILIALIWNGFSWTKLCSFLLRKTRSFKSK